MPPRRAPAESDELDPPLAAGGRAAAAAVVVHDVLDVRRPTKRRGQQLEVLISWAAHDWAGFRAGLALGVWADES